MKRSLGIGILILIVGLVLVAVIPRKSQRPPTFQGKPLDAWLVQLFSKYPRYDDDAVFALRAMGDEVVLALAETVDKDDSFLTKELLRQVGKFPALGELVDSRYWNRWVAAKALGVLGTKAGPALPALRRLEKNPDNLLASVGRAALFRIENGSLEQLMTNYLNYADRTNFSIAYGILLELGPYAKAAIPILTNELTSTNSSIRITAGNVLRGIAIDSPEYAPFFLKLTDDNAPLIRNMALDVLTNMGDHSQPTVAAVATKLDDSSPLCRSSALVYMSKVLSQEEFAPYLNKITGMTNDSDSLVRMVAVSVLKEKQLLK